MTAMSQGEAEFRRQLEGVCANRPSDAGGKYRPDLVADAVIALLRAWGSDLPWETTATTAPEGE